MVVDEDIKKGRFRFLLNVIFVILLLFMIGCRWYIGETNKSLEKALNEESQTITKLKNDLAEIQAVNKQTVYLSESDSSNLTLDQKKSIVLLTDIFTRITTFNSSTAYEANYDYATKYIKDSNFYSEFLAKPRDDAGNSVVEMSGLKMDNVRTVVVPIGKDSYRVFVSFVAYHADSDLYQRNSLKVTHKIVDVQGSFEDFTKTTVQDHMGSNTTITRVSDIN